jgi:hypothetical protein
MEAKFVTAGVLSAPRQNYIYIKSTRKQRNYAANEVKYKCAGNIEDALFFLLTPPARKGGNP